MDAVIKVARKDPENLMRPIRLVSQVLLLLCFICCAASVAARRDKYENKNLYWCEKCVRGIKKNLVTHCWL